MSFIENLDRAASVAICSWLREGGNAALGTAVVGGLAIPGGQVPSIGAGLGLLALNYGCAFDPDNIRQVPNPALTGCMKSTGLVQVGFSGRPGEYFATRLREVVSVGHATPPKDEPQDRKYVSLTTIGETGTNSGPVVLMLPIGSGGLVSAPMSGSTCIKTADNNDYTGPQAVTHNDTECNINIDFESWVVEDDGTVRPVLKMSSAATQFASGGVISGCNFEPVIYSPAPPGGGGGGGGPWVAPWQPGPGGGDGEEPWWYPLLKGAASGAVGAVVSKIVSDLLDKLFPKTLPGVTYRLESVCEVNAQGQPISQAVERVIPSMETFAALDARLGAIVDIAQGLKDFKQPICAPERRSPTGEMVSVNFQSRSIDTPGQSPVRKELRYRDQDGHPESFHRAHWTGFSWETGNSIVTSRGLTWGVVQVWAASADEGKRVIGHAAAAAGVDLSDPKHRWEITSSTNPRYGRQARVVPVIWDATDGLMISKRDGPSGPPTFPRDP